MALAVTSTASTGQLSTDALRSQISNTRMLTGKDVHMLIDVYSFE